MTVGRRFESFRADTPSTTKSASSCSNPFLSKRSIIRTMQVNAESPLSVALPRIIEIVNITIHRGTKEVGGTCIEVQGGRTRLILDLGMPLFEPSGEPRDLRASQRKGIQGLKADGTLPQVPGLFEEGPAPDAILLSHAHSDHTGLVFLTRPQIPVYLTTGTSKMLLAASVFAGQPSLLRGRARDLKPGTPTMIGEIKVTALPVDHSAFDSVALLLEWNGKRILYSGDLRLHGRKPGMAKRLVAHTRRHPVDVLMLEGTHLGSSNSMRLSETDLEDQLVREAGTAAGLVLAAFSPLNVDRLVSYYRAARRSGRIFVIDPYAAFVLHLVASQSKVPRPGGTSGIRVVYPDLSMRRRPPPDKILRMFRKAEIGLEDVLRQPERHLVIFRESMLAHEFGGRLPTGSILLYSYWSGYLKQERGIGLRTRLEAARARIVFAHASGHIHPEDLSEFVRAIGPKTLIPVHTFHPKRFGAMWPEVRLPRDGETLTV